MTGSPTDYVAEWKFGSARRQNEKNNNKINKQHTEQEPSSSHGRTVKKQCAEQEPRSAHGRAVN